MIANALPKVPIRYTAIVLHQSSNQLDPDQINIPNNSTPLSAVLFRAIRMADPAMVGTRAKTIGIILDMLQELSANRTDRVHLAILFVRVPSAEQSCH